MEGVILDYQLRDWQIIALRSVLNGRSDDPAKFDLEYYLRKVKRWYSKTFCTPLHEVDALPMSDILLAYYEENFEALGDEELRDEAKNLSKTPKQVAKEARERDEGEVEDLLFEEQVRLEKERADRAKAANAVAKLGQSDLIKDVKPRFDALVQGDAQEINISFVTPEQLEAEMERIDKDG